MMLSVLLQLKATLLKNGALLLNYNYKRHVYCWKKKKASLLKERDMKKLKN